MGDHKSTSRKKEEIHTTTIYGRWNTYSRLNLYLLKIGLVYPSQEGFCKGRNTVRYLSKLTSSIKGDQSRKLCILCLFIEEANNSQQFNEYFASIATKLNNVENPEHKITSPETFKQFMPPSNEDSIFSTECTQQEVAEIISQLQNGKSSDFPIRVIKSYLQSLLLFNCTIQ